jgi:protein tyrosine/serine phosphatase
MRKVLDSIDGALSAGRTVYVHCWGGVGRTGMAVGCYLVRHGLSGEKALAQLAEWWQYVPKHQVYTRSPETDEQVEFILNWKE